MAEVLALVGILVIAITAGRRNGRVLAMVIKTAELTEEVTGSEFPQRRH